MSVTAHYSDMILSIDTAVFEVQHVGTSGSRGIAPFILNLCTSWRWVVNFPPRPFCFDVRAPEPVWSLSRSLNCCQHVVI